MQAYSLAAAHLSEVNVVLFFSAFAKAAVPSGLMFLVQMLHERWMIVKMCTNCLALFSFPLTSVF